MPINLTQDEIYSNKFKTELLEIVKTIILNDPDYLVKLLAEIYQMQVDIAKRERARACDMEACIALANIKKNNKNINAIKQKLTKWKPDASNRWDEILEDW